MTLRESIRGLLGWPFDGLRTKSLESGTPGVEGQPKEGPWYIQGQGWLPAEWGSWNYWQMDLDPLQGGGSTVAEACIAAYAQTIAMCPGDHWKALPNGGRERVTTSALSRILRRPNDYQSRSDFMLGLAANLYRDGNAYCLATRNDRFEVAALHPFDSKQSHALTDGSGNVFYELTGNNVVDKQFASRNGTTDWRLPGMTSTTSIIAPARDVLHVKLEPERGQPLTGVPPARHAAAAIAAQRAIGGQMSTIFGNLNRPAGVIETGANLTGTQTGDFRKRFNEAWRGIDNLDGGPPILPQGMTWKSVSMTAQEAEVSTMLRLSQDEIFMAFGVPPAILGMTDRSTFASTEALMQFWLARGLGFALNHVEVAFDQFFGLRGFPEDYTEFDTAALLRVAYKERIEGLARGIQAGLYSPNEGRRFEELPSQEHGDEARLQAQMVPLSAWSMTAPKTPMPAAAPAAVGAGQQQEQKPQEDQEPAEKSAANVQKLLEWLN